MISDPLDPESKVATPMRRPGGRGPAIHAYLAVQWRRVVLWASSVVGAGPSPPGIRAGLTIDRARARGLWPPPGQSPTEGDLHRLVRIGEMFLAVRMCRQIRNLSRGEAMVAVRRITRESA